MAEGLIPENYLDDALHIAIAVTRSLDCIVSLNFRHIVRADVMAGVNRVNANLGYPAIVICTPEMIP